MSYVFNKATATSIGAVSTLTGNSGGAVSPTLGNLNILGAGGITTTGNPGTSTITISGGGGITTITGDTGGALTGTNITFAGGSTGLTFNGAGTTETLVFAGITANGGTVSLATDATASTVNIGTGAGSKNVTIGSTNTTSTLQLNAGSGGVRFQAVAEGALVTSSASVISTVTGTAGFVLTANAAGTAPSFQAIPSGLIAWTDVTTTSASMVVNAGYVADNAGLVTLTLPATAAFGSVIRVVGKGAGLWTIAQNAGQSIKFGTLTSTVGVGGSASAILANDCVELLCTTANTTFTVMSSMGNVTIV